MKQGKIVLSIIAACLIVMWIFRSNRENDMEPYDPDCTFTGFYSAQSVRSDPGKYAGFYDAVPDDIAGIVRFVNNIMIHIGQIEMQSIPFPKRNIDKELNNFRVEKILEKIVVLNGSPLVEARKTGKKYVGICAHFALLTCSILRHKNIPARVPGGFEAYHSNKIHHDHWIVEYWDNEQNRWIQVDPQMNEFFMKKWNFTFNPLDVPDEKFITGAEAWKLIRKGIKSGSNFGIYDDQEWTTGLEFIVGDLLLDFNSINKNERLPWMDYRNAKNADNLTKEENAVLDTIADMGEGDNGGFGAFRRYFTEHAKKIFAGN